MKKVPKVRNEYAVINKYRESIPVDLDEICRELGVRVRTAYLNKDMSGMIETNGRKQYTITVNENDHRLRQRFTIAHELGHYIMHRVLIGNGTSDNRAYRSTPDGMYYNTNIGRAEETDANKFAASVLMPWDKVEERRTEYIGPPEDMARRLAREFEVSTRAMEIRLSQDPDD